MRVIGLALANFLAATAAWGATTEFCIDGEFDLAARAQGWSNRPGEWVPATWCVTSDDGTERVRFAATGKSNPDMHGDWTVAFLPPEVVRIVNRQAPPDIEFTGAAGEEALRHRRIDPRRLEEEIRTSPAWVYDEASGVARLPGSGHAADVSVTVENDRVRRIESSADMPLKGRVPVTWSWDWSDPPRPGLTLAVDGQAVFRGQGAWREIPADTAPETWQATPGAEPIRPARARWPASINMRRIELAPGTWLVRGVRTGFQHLVADTADGLVVADAPAGWVEIHQLPPTDLVPGKGVSGLSEAFIAFLEAEFPGRPLHAVVLTHAHDDHAGGARAFAAAGADIYAPDVATPFLAAALNRESMPPDSLEGGKRASLFAVGRRLGVSDRVEVLAIGPGPHVNAALGVFVPDADVFFVSDLHVPTSELAIPRAERVGTECWFADWAVRNLPSRTRVANSHSAPLTPVSRLERYLEHPDCLDLAGPETKKALLNK